MSSSSPAASAAFLIERGRFWRVDLPTVDPLTNVDVGFREVAPLQPKDLSGAKAGKNGKFHDQPFSLFKGCKAFLYLL